MTDTLTPAPADADGYYDERVAALSTVPFWHLGEFHEPTVPERAHVWHWDEVVPELLRSRDVLDEGAGVAPAPGPAAAQPGPAPAPASAPPTRWSPPTRCCSRASRPRCTPTRSRRCASGRRAAAPAWWSTVEARAACARATCVLTPAGCWHGHVHPGGDEPVVWFDGLDVPLRHAAAGRLLPAAPSG